MKIEMRVGSNGQVERNVDFEGATLPNGRNIDEVLNENETLKKDIIDLEKEVKESSSILARVIPGKKLRDLVEIILIIGTIWGIIVLF